MKKNRLIFTLLFCTMALFVASCSASSEEEVIDSSDPWEHVDEEDVYDTYTLSGFTVTILHDITTYSGSADAWQQLQDDINAVESMIPSSSALATIKSHEINVINNSRITIDYDTDPTSEYYGSVVIGDIGIYKNLVQRNQTNLLLRYLAEIYYDKNVTSAQKSALEAAYNAGKDEYGSVYYSNGTTLEVSRVASPAVDDVLNYFLELTEAYFDGNDYYPFDYLELKRHDPAGLAAVADVWGARSVPDVNEYGVGLPPADMMSRTAVGDNTYGAVYPIDTWYRKYIVANCPGGDYHIVASRFVTDSVLVQCKTIVELMAKDEGSDEFMKNAVADNLSNNFYMGILGKNETVTAMPENRNWTAIWGGDATSWNRSRGYGSTNYMPMMTICEENICKVKTSEGWPNESVLVHEFGHNLDLGLRGSVNGFTERLLAAYANAQANGLWGNSYAMGDNREYFGEGIQAWYDCCNMTFSFGDPAVSMSIRTREDLLGHDPTLWGIMNDYLPNDVRLTGYHFDW